MASRFRLVEEDRSLMEGVFGVEAVDYFVRSASNNMLSQFTASCSDLRPEVLEGLIKIIEWFDWTYAIYWQVSASESGKSALIWGAGHYQAGERNSNSDLNGGRGKQRKAALHKLQACLGGSGDGGMNSGLDLVSGLEIFYHASKYFVFPFDESSSHNQAFHSGKAIWISDAKCFSEHYQSRAFLARAVQLETVAFIPLEGGLVEIGSRKSLGKDLKIINRVKDVFGSNVMQPTTFPRIFGQELALGGAKSSGDSDEHSLIQMARNILKSDYVKATMFSNDTLQELGLGGVKSDDVSDDHNLIQMPKTTLKSDYVKENMCSNVIVQEASIGGAKSGSISTRFSSNKNYHYSLEAARHTHKEGRKNFCVHKSVRRKKPVKKSIKVQAFSKNLADIPPDEHSWRKYGQKPLKGSPYPRGYYKCSILRGCPARKEVERCLDDPTMLVVTYRGEHEHLGLPSRAENS